MQKVISINLNGNAYQLDESGYERCAPTSSAPSRSSRTIPERAEIVADLEQAIADKCQRFLGPHKSVVTAGEIDQIIVEMGPVDAAAGRAGSAAATSAGGNDADQPSAPPKRLYRISEGAMVAGVCNGLAAYLNIDVTLVRVVFVIVGAAHQGRRHPRLRRHDVRHSRGEDIRGARRGRRRAVQREGNRRPGDEAVAESTPAVRREWRQQRRQWRHHGIGGRDCPSSVPPGLACCSRSLAWCSWRLFLIMVAMLISLVNSGGVPDWQLPADVPVWAAALILLVAYQVVVAPLRAAQQLAPHPPAAVRNRVAYAFWNAVGVAVRTGARRLDRSQAHGPEIREFLQRLPALFRELVHAIRDATAR